jgi:uncharacterized RDD family membrane protein YckC
VATDYLLVINGKPEGPFSIKQLKDLNIRPGDFVRTAKMDDYKEAHEIAELREIFHFSKPLVIPQYFAGFDQRLLASALDWFFVSGVFILVAFIAVVFIDDKTIRLSIAFSLLGLIPLTKFIYHVVMECSDKQATYGKQIIKIKVCDLEGNRISPGRSISRNLCKIFSLITVAGYLVSFFNKQQQCLHDMMAGTLVMKDRLL